MRASACLVVLALAGSAAGKDMPLSEVLLPGEGWTLVKGFKAPHSLAADRAGHLYVADDVQVLRAEKDGKRTPFVKDVDPVLAMRFGPGGVLYAAQSNRGRIVSYDSTRKEKVVSESGGYCLAVTADGRVYGAGDERGIYLSGVGGSLAKGVKLPYCMTLSPDGGTLVVGDYAGKHLYAFRVGKDGTLSAKERYYALRVRASEESQVMDLTMDAAGRLYAATAEGVQVFDPTGRLSGVMLSPGRKAVTAVAFAGPERDRLYVICGGKVYVRKVKAKGVAPPK